VGNTSCSLREIVALLRPGDIVTHVYTGNENGILGEDGRILPEIWEARERGVLFEIGHGRTQMNYDIARVALEAGFPPDLIGSDISKGNWQGPSFDLATVTSKLIALGMDADAAIAAMTSAPARVLGIEDEGFGRIRVGSPAKITVIDERSDFDDVPDAAGAALRVSRLDPLYTVDGDAVQQTVAWRGYAVAAAAVG
jgi:dihydroorotase